jgi:hypothetical protein
MDTWRLASDKVRTFVGTSGVPVISWSGVATAAGAYALPTMGDATGPREPGKRKLFEWEP